MPPLRRPPPRPVVAGAFFVCVLAVPLAGRMLRPAPEPSWTPAELAEALRQCRPALHVIPVNAAGPEYGIYICEHPQPRQRVLGLIRQREYAQRWQGVVHCERIGGHHEIAAEDLVAWGKHGLRVGPLLFFGDPRLLADIAPILGGEGIGH